MREIEHGTARGYTQHYRWRVLPVCEPCADARRAYVAPAAVAARRAARTQPRNRIAPCGTDAGYQRHLRRKEPTCPPCRAAHVAKNTELWKRRNPPRCHGKTRHLRTQQNTTRWWSKTDQRWILRCLTCQAVNQQRYKPRRRELNRNRKAA